MQIDHSKLAFQMLHIFFESGEWATFKEAVVLRIKESLLIEVQKSLKKYEEKQQSEIKELKKLITDKDPGLLKDYSKIHEEICKRSEEFDKKIKLIDTKLKKLVESSTLCEDVYGLRDEMKELKKLVSAFETKIKKVFS